MTKPPEQKDTDGVIGVNGSIDITSMVVDNQGNLDMSGQAGNMVLTLTFDNGVKFEVWIDTLSIKGKVLKRPAS
jgi:hypothetical protein